MAYASGHEKPVMEPSKNAAATQSRWSTASLRRYLRALRYRFKILVFTYSMIYLVRHWFDFFCPPWTLDGILLSESVPYCVSIPIFIGSLAWGRRTLKLATFVGLCCLAVMFYANDFYYRVYLPEVDLRLFSTKSVVVCAFMVLTAVFGDCKVEPPEESSAAPEHYSTEDAEAARDNKSTESHIGSAQTSAGRSQTKIGSWMARNVVNRLPNIRTASTLAFIAAVATMITHPPTLVQDYLSSINCEAHVAKLDYDDQHFQFSATSKKTGMFASFCSGPQQLLTIESVMNEHVNKSDATCGVWCARLAEDGQVFGYISQVTSGLVDMYYCRGQYGSFGPDCEVEGDDYGYDVSREGWMNDVHEPWCVLEEGVDARSVAYEKYIGKASE
jgi:hypothetical protein